MPTDPPLGPLSDADFPAAARMLSLAFAGSTDAVEKWVRDAGLEHMRLYRPADAPAGAPPAACLLRVPMAQFVGGRSVPMTGIAGVAVPPEQRGQGHALAMMRAAIREIAADGTPLSVLYASTQSLYRQVGYEQAGHACRITLPVRPLGLRERGMTVRPATPDDEPAIRANYRDFASRFDGTLDRGSYCWSRTRRFRDQEYQGWCVVPHGADHADGPVEGYAFLRQERKATTGRQDLLISDLAFTTPRAGRRLLGFLADFATMADDAVIDNAGPVHPILTLLPLQSFRIERKEYWMLRITRLREALESRGWPAGLTISLMLDAHDDLVPANHGRFTLRVESGRARVEPGGDGPALHADIRGLAPLYTGFFSAPQAALAGLVEIDPGASDAAATLFPGSCPWMADFF